MMLALRPHQVEGVGDIRAQFARRMRSVLYVLPTGGGKTVVFSHVTEGAAEKGNAVLILVHRDELVKQTSRALHELGVAHGIIAAGYSPNRANVQVCMVQTMARRIKAGKARLDFKLIIVDEAHHATAGAWRTILEAMPQAKVLGVTATPVRLDGKGLGTEAGGIFDAMVVGPTMQWLIDEGYLCRPVVYAPPVQFSFDGLHTRGGDFVATELSERIQKPTVLGDAVAHYRRLCGGQPAIVFCPSVAAAEATAKEFAAAGYRARSLDGSMDDGERRNCINGLGNGAIQVLTSCDIISEGTDIPVVAAAILLRPTQSEGLYLQQVGRALRPVYAPGFDLSTREGRLAAIAASSKPVAIVLDHVGNTARHGLPADERSWTLAADGGAASKGGKGGGVAVRQCPTCFCAHVPRGTCPQCGHVYVASERKVTREDGELVEVNEAQAREIRKQRAADNYRKNADIYACHTLEDFQRVGQARGYKPAWAVHRWRHYEQSKIRKGAA